MNIEIAFYIAGGGLVLGSGIVQIGTRLWLKPPDIPEEEEVYWEFEEEDPRYQRYTRWLQLSLTGICLGVLLLFVAIAV
jgi:hypothetical protein